MLYCMTTNFCRIQIFHVMIDLYIKLNFLGDRTSLQFEDLRLYNEVD